MSALVALAVALPILVIGWQLDRQRQARLSVAKSELMVAAVAIAREHVTLVAEARAILSALAVVPELQLPDAICTEALRSKARLLPLGIGLSVTGWEGYATCATFQTDKPIYLGDRDYFRTAFETGHFVVSDVVLARAHGQPVVVAALPGRDEQGVVNRVLTAAIDITALARLIARNDPGGQRFAVLLNPDGRILAAQPASAGTDHPALARVINGQEQGSAIVTDGAGTRQLFGFAQLPHSRAWIAVGLPAAAVEAPLAVERRQIALLLLAAVALTGAITWWFASVSLLRGLRAIGAAAREGTRFAAAAPDALAAPELHVLHDALVANEQRREAAESRWRTLGEAGAQIVWRVTPDGRTIESLGWEALTGAPTECIYSPDLGGLLHPDDVPARRAAWERAQDAERYEAEFRVAVLAKPGADHANTEPAGAGRVWRWMQSRGVPVRDRQGQLFEWVGTLRDVDDSRRDAGRLAEREARLRSVLETAGDAILVIDEHGRLTEVNPAAEQMFGWSKAELTGRDSALLIPSDGAGPRFVPGASPTATLDVVLGKQRELDARRRDGSQFPIEMSLARFRDAAGRSYHTAILRDVSARRAATAALAESERRFRLLAENSGDVIIMSNTEGRRLYVSPSSTQVLGWTPEQVMGQRPTDLAHPDDSLWLAAAIEAMADGEPATEVTYRIRRPDGSWVWVEGRARANFDANGRGTGYVATLRDATERKAAEQRLLEAFERLEELAATDSLTGLANRRRFDDALRHEWRRAEREQTPLSIALIDADRFKLYNDRYGHPAGDDCLRVVANAISAAARRGGDLPARHGGEEFAMLMSGTDMSGATAVAERIRALVEAEGRPHASNTPSGVVTVSVGVATAYPWAPGALPSPDALLSAADNALYAAKASGRNRLVFAMPDTGAEPAPTLIPAPVAA